MIEWILSSSVLILVVIALRFVLRGKISLRLQYALWAIVLFRLALPMSLAGADFSLMQAVTETEIYETIDHTMHTTQVHSHTVRDTELGYHQAEAGYEGTIYKIHGYSVESGNSSMHTYFFRDSLSLVLSRILKTVWLLGAVGTGLYLITVNLFFGWRLRKSRKVFECGASLPVYLSQEVKTPCMYGLFRPAIYLTEEITKDTAALHHVLAHEVTHYRHKDHIWSALRCAALALHWYNPLVWWAAILSRRDAELACDEGAIRHLGEEERISYGSTLIGLSCTTKRAEGVLLTATTMTGSKRSLKERIVLIARKPKTAAIALAVVICVLLVSILCTFTGARHNDSLFRRYPSFTEWVNTLTVDEIEWAEAAKGYGADKVSYTLTESDYEDLVGLFKNLGEDDFSRKNPGGASTDVHLPLYRQDKLWLFKCLDDGTVGLMFNDPETGAYFGCEGRYLIIYSEELWNYIAELVSEKGSRY